MTSDKTIKFWNSKRQWVKIGIFIVIAITPGAATIYLLWKAGKIAQDIWRHRRKKTDIVRKTHEEEKEK